MMIRLFAICLLIIGSAFNALAQEAESEFNTLYRVTLLRAEPGSFSTLLDAMQQRSARQDYYVLRHSQGDHWDLMSIEPIGSYAQWFNKDNHKRQDLDGMWREHLDRISTFREEWFAYGPNKEMVKQGVAENNLYHVEMFRALAGHKNKLLQQRFMENAYLQKTGQVVNLVFKGDQGADWDVMTIGFHKDLTAFAKGSEMNPEQKDQIAKQVGFASASDIGPYLRSLLVSHNDTLAVSVK